MITKVIKRDGSKQDFDPSKINGWSEWAAGFCGNVDWGEMVMLALAGAPNEITTTEIQERLIQACLDQDSWDYQKMAGRLYAPFLHKQLYPMHIPTIRALHQEMIKDGILQDLGYSEKEYGILEEEIIHRRDYYSPHFSLHYIRNKYALKNRHSGKEYETQQFVYMRMAMALASEEPESKKLDLAIKFYRAFSAKLLSAPTPNYVNLGTSLKGFASCCLYAVDDNEPSLAVGDHIAYRMTAASAGIGSHLMTRSKGDPVRGGLIEHQGKLPYFAALGKAVKANMQTSRGGACTTYYSGFDPEAQVIAHLRNPRSTEDRKNRDLHYCLITNKFFAEKVAKNEKAFSFNVFTAPELHKLFFSGNYEAFKAEYTRLENDPIFKKDYFSPRELVLTVLNESLETGVAYLMNVDEVNRHTPFIDPIHSSNLCLEVAEPTTPYQDMRDLYSRESVGYINIISDNKGKREDFSLEWNKKITLVDGTITFAGNLKVGNAFRSYYLGEENIIYTVKEIEYSYPEPEVALCSLAAINVSNNLDDATYAELMYLALKMIDYCIENSEYKLPHIGFTAKQRMNAGVGMMGLATWMANNNHKYDTQEGLQAIHVVFERHMYHAIKASLKIAKERGVAPWIHKTKWVNGWLPIDSYNENIDPLVGNIPLFCPWESLRKEIKEVGGIAHSTLVNIMPGESSSKALGTANSVYPVRDASLTKTDGGITIHWAANMDGCSKEDYQIAWDINEIDMIKAYAVMQKFVDQSISADLWRRIKDDNKVSSSELLQQYLSMFKYGMKTRYYFNSNVANGNTLEDSGNLQDGIECESCTL